MFLNSYLPFGYIGKYDKKSYDMAETIQRNDFETYGALIGKTWMQNQALDCGTNPPAVEEIINKIKDYTLGYKLPGAGGGRSFKYGGERSGG